MPEYSKIVQKETELEDLEPTRKPEAIPLTIHNISYYFDEDTSADRESKRQKMSFDIHVNLKDVKIY